MDWTETYLNKNDLNQMMWNIDWQKVGYSEGFKMINLYLENMENR